MKLLLDCDDVFDRLTRGPFPSGATDDAAVESHLCACHECRELAEALRPAVNLLHEAYAAQVSDESLPAYRGAAPVDLASPSARLPACPTSARALSTKEWSLGWQLVAASLIGVAIGSLAATGWLSNKENSPAAASAGGPQA